MRHHAKIHAIVMPFHKGIDSDSKYQKIDLAVFQSAPYPRICHMLIDILKQFLNILFLIHPKNKGNGCDLLFEKLHSDLTLTIL